MILERCPSHFRFGESNAKKLELTVSTVDPSNNNWQGNHPFFSHFVVQVQIVLAAPWRQTFNFLSVY